MARPPAELSPVSRSRDHGGSERGKAIRDWRYVVFGIAPNE
jgi:hypothetical protein